jgi:hypothetical protein
MAIDLPEVNQEFDANTQPYVDAIARAIAAAKEFADANYAAVRSVLALQTAMAGLHDKTVEITIKTVNDVLDEHTDVLKTVADSAGDASGEATRLTQQLRDLTEAASDARDAESGLSSALRDEDGNLIYTAIAAMRTVAAMRAFSAASREADTTSVSLTERQLELGNAAVQGAADAAMLGRVIKDQNTDYLDIAATTKDVINVQSELGRSYLDTAARMKQVIDAAAELDTTSVSLTERQLELGNAAVQGAADAAMLGRVIRDQNTDYLATAAATKDVINVQSDLGGSYLETAARIKQVIEGAAELDTAVKEDGTTFRDLIAPIAAWGSTMSAAFGSAGLRIGGFRVNLAAVHWILTGTMEALAILVPATIALGAGFAVGAQGAQLLYSRLQATWTAAESMGGAFNVTAGSILGMGRSLQTAQNEANPGIYELLGAYVNIAKSSFQGLAGVGLQVVHMFDEFAARVTVDMKGAMGGEVQGLLANMISDLRELGQIFANLGHALVNFANAMPGLIELLLGLANWVSRVALAFTSMPAGILTAAIALEEFYRWGGLAMSLLARFLGMGAIMNKMLPDNAGFILKFGAALLTLGQAVSGILVWIGALIGLVARAIPFLGALGEAFIAAGVAVKNFFRDLTPGQAAGWAGLFALGAIAEVALSRVKNAIQNMISGINAAVAKATDMTIMTVLTQGLEKVTTGLISQTAALHSYSAGAQLGGQAAAGLVDGLSKLPGPISNAVQGIYNLSAKGGVMSSVLHSVGGALEGLVPGMHIFDFLGTSAEQSASNIDRLHTEQQKLVGEAGNVISNTNRIASAFHISAAAALVLANAAGVNLSSSLAKGSAGLVLASQQIKNYLTGIGDMGKPIGTIENDINALGVSSMLSSSKVGQLNSAWDQFVSTGTSGMTSLVQFEGQIKQMGSDALSSSVSLTGAITSIARSAASAGYTLKGMGTMALQSWQQFNSAINQGESSIDFLRTGMAEGVVSAHSFGQSVRAIVGQMLPFAAGNKTAVAELSMLAQEAGGPATSNLKTLANWAGMTGNKAAQVLAKGIESATQSMSNLTTVARNLSATVSGQMDASMAAAIVKTSGLSGAWSKYLSLVKDNAPLNEQAAALGKVRSIEQSANDAVKAGTIANASNSTSLKDVAAAAAKASDAYRGITPAAQSASRATTDNGETSRVAAEAHATLASRVTGTHTAVSGLTGPMNTLNSNTSRATTEVHNLGDASSTTRGQLGTVNNEIRATATAAGAARGPLGTMSDEIRNVGSSASTAAREVNSLETAIRGLTSKTVVVNYEQNDTTTLTTISKSVKAARGGLISGPGTGTSDSIPARLSSGEYVLNARAVAHYGHATLDRMNAMRMAGGGPVGSWFEPSGSVSHEHPIVIKLDGQVLWHSMQQRTMRYNTRNSGSRTGQVIPGTRPQV